MKRQTVRAKNKVKVFPDRETAQKHFDKAIRGADNLDVDSPVFDESLDEWLSRTHRRIKGENPLTITERTVSKTTIKGALPSRIVALKQRQLERRIRELESENTSLALRVVKIRKSIEG